MSEMDVDRISDLVALFESGCDTYGDEKAFSCMGNSISYLELERASRDFAAYLQHKAGLVPGDRIAIQLPNMIDYPVIVWGSLRAGLVLVNTNPQYTPRELRHQFCDSGARALVVFAELLPVLEQVLSETDIDTVVAVSLNKVGTDPDSKLDVTLFSSALQIGARCGLDPVKVQPDDVALLQYTGGTTGLPKAAMLTHTNLLASAFSFWRTLEILHPGEEIFVAPLPLYHVYAFVSHMVIGVAFGVHSVLIANPRDVDEFVGALKGVPFSCFFGINTLFVSLCQNDEFCALDFSSLKFTLSGGTALSRSAAERWQQVTGCPVYEGYGLTEATAGVSVNTPGHYQPGTIGTPKQGVEVKVVDDDGNELPAGEVGELCVRGAQVMKGYWRQPDATREAISDRGWLYTGDMAIIQDDGFIRIVERKKDLIIVSGFNVYPNEVEAVVDSLPEVLECAAVGCADEKSGEVVKLFVVTKSAELNEESVRNHCRKNLVAYKIPKYIEFVEALPKSPVGKILRRQLR